MSNETEQKSLQKPAEDRSATKKDDKKSFNKSAIFIPILTLIVLVFFYYHFSNQLKQLEKDTDNLSIFNAGSINQMELRIKTISDKLATMQNVLAEAEAKLELLSQALPTEQQFYTNQEYALAEIEHLLIIASYNLQLDHDVSTALAAMEAADARLNGLGDPRILDVRQQLISDMNTLRSLNQADLSGLGLYLSDLINRIDLLPLQAKVVVEQIASDELIKQESTNDLKQFLLLIWKELKSLVVITRDEDVAKARLMPDEIYFLRANIKLELANARFAVFNRDTENFHASIGHIQNWINNYFDMSDAAVRNIYDSLEKMKRMNLNFPQLDITSSLESVRALIRSLSDADNALIK